MDGGRERLVVGLHGAFVGALQVLQRQAHLIPIGGIGLLDRHAQQVHAVVGVRQEAEGGGRSHLGRHAVIQLLLRGRAVVGDGAQEEGLLRQRLARCVVERDVVRRPGSQRQGEPVDLLHAAEHMRDRRALRPDHHRVHARGLQLVQLRGHIGVGHAELLHRDRLDALRRPDGLQILERALAIAGGLDQEAHVLDLGILLQVADHAVHLLAIDHANSKHVVVGARAHGLGDVGARTDRPHHRNLLLVRNVLPGQRVARVGRPHDRHDLLVVDQVAHVLDRLGRLRQVIAHHQHQLTAQQAAGRVDVVDGGAQSQHRRLPALRRRRSRQVAVEADLDVLGLGLRADGQRA
ncbi:hypothetical protein D9M68_573530 [compost metagenome]